MNDNNTRRDLAIVSGVRISTKANPIKAPAMATTPHRRTRVWGHFAITAAVVGIAVAFSSVAFAMPTARFRSARVNTSVIHL